MPTKQKLTPKEKKFLKAKARGASNSEAALEAYDTDNPDVVGSQVMARPRVQNAFQKALADAGVDDPLLAGIYREALDATYVGYDPDSRETTERPDHGTRLRAADQVHKLRHDYPSEKGDTNINISIVEQLAAKVAEREFDVDIPG